MEGVGWRSAFAVIIHSSAFSFSGKVQSRTETSSHDQCCELNRNRFGRNRTSETFVTPLDQHCRTPPTGGSESHEGVRTFEENTVVWDDDLHQLSFLVPSETELVDWTSSLEAVVIVRVKKVTRICDEASSEGPVYSGMISGIRIPHGGEGGPYPGVRAGHDRRGTAGPGEMARREAGRRHPVGGKMR